MNLLDVQCGQLLLYPPLGMESGVYRLSYRQTGGKQVYGLVCQTDGCVMERFYRTDRSEPYQFTSRKALLHHLDSQGYEALP